MAKGAWSASGKSSQIVAADAHRPSLIIQLWSGDPTSFAFGEDAVFIEGLRLVTAGDFIELTRHQATLAVHAICDTGNSSSGGYQS